LLDKGLVGRVVEVERSIPGVATVVIRTPGDVVLLAGRDIDYIVVPIVVVRARRCHGREANIQGYCDRAYIQCAIERLLRYELPGRIQLTVDRLTARIVKPDILPGEPA